MSVRPSRTVRWFGTKVPLLSRGVLAIETLLLALVIGWFLALSYGYAIIEIGVWLFPILIVLMVGMLVHPLHLLIMKSRFERSPDNAPFLDVVSRVYQKILVPSRVKVWTRQSNEPYIVSTYNPVFDAVIVSEPMVELILNSPEAGEVLLAFHLTRIPRTPWFGDYVGSIILLMILTYFSSIYMVLIIQILSMVGYMGPLGIIALGPILSYLVIPFFFTLIIKGAFWRHESAFLRVQEVYGMHPQVAKVAVERGYPLNEEEMQAVVWGVKEWERKKRGSRRWGMSILVAAPTWFLFLLAATYFGGPTYMYYFFFIAYGPFIGAAIVAGLVYFMMKRWDKNAMGEVFHEVVETHEPIWMD